MFPSPSVGSTSHSSPGNLVHGTSSRQIPGSDHPSSSSIRIELSDELVGPHSLDMMDIKLGSPGVLLASVDRNELEATLLTSSCAIPASTPSSEAPATVAITKSLGRGGFSNVYATSFNGVSAAIKLSVPFTHAMQENSDSATRITDEEVAHLQRDVRGMLAKGGAGPGWATGITARRRCAQVFRRLPRPCAHFGVCAPVGACTPRQGRALGHANAAHAALGA